MFIMADPVRSELSMQMHKKRIEKDDGRFLYYYWFDGDSEPVIEQQPAEPPTRNPEPPRV